MHTAEAVVEPEVMPLRRTRLGPARPAQKQVHYKMREDLKAYVDGIKAAEDKADEEGTLPRPPRDQSDIINDAVALERDLGVELDADASRIEAWATATGLDMDTALAKVLAQLVRKGLDAIDAESAGKPHQKRK